MQVFKLHEAYRATPGAQGDWIAPPVPFLAQPTADIDADADQTAAAA